MPDKILKENKRLQMALVTQVNNSVTEKDYRNNTHGRKKIGVTVQKKVKAQKNNTPTTQTHIHAHIHTCKYTYSSTSSSNCTHHEQ